MISSLSGKVLHKDLNHIVIEVGGVGYKVFVQTSTALETKVSENASLWTHLSVRETSLDLFGFPEKETLEIFELLITISGIGPKTALGILNVASPETLRQAVSGGDTSYLTRISGIGKKNAEKIVLELKGKLHAKEEDGKTSVSRDTDVLEALISLGYKERDAREALKKVPEDIEDTSERVRGALKNLNNA